MYKSSFPQDERLARLATNHTLAHRLASVAWNEFPNLLVRITYLGCDKIQVKMIPPINKRRRMWVDLALDSTELVVTTYSFKKSPKTYRNIHDVIEFMRGFYRSPFGKNIDTFVGYIRKEIPEAVIRSVSDSQNVWFDITYGNKRVIVQFKYSPHRWGVMEIGVTDAVDLFNQRITPRLNFNMTGVLLPLRSILIPPPAA